MDACVSPRLQKMGKGGLQTAAPVYCGLNQSSKSQCQVEGEKYATYRERLLNLTIFKIVVLQITCMDL